MKSVVAFGVVLVGLLTAMADARADLTFQAQSISNGLHVILVSGKFEASDNLQTFQSLVISNRSSVVTFNSGGGSVGKALELGRLIRQLGLSTAQARSFECASACALAFLGGVQRYADAGSIGVHQSSFSDTAGLSADDAVARTQSMTAVVMSYVAEMGVDPGFLQIALSYDSSDIRYLSSSEMAQYRITTDNPPRAAPMTAYAPPSPAPPAPEAPALEPDKESATETAVLAFVRSVIQAHTRSKAEAFPTLLSSYADYVQYYGTRKPWADVIRDKENYFRRWPQRVYQLKDDTITVTCRPFACEVSGQYAWAVQSLKRNKQASGTASFRYVIDITKSMRIIDESSEVLSR